MRADHVLEHANDVGFEFLDVGAVEDGTADADHARPDLIDAHLGGRARQQRRHPDHQRCKRDCEPTDWHGCNSVIREKCLLVKEKWAIVLTAIATVCYRLSDLMPQSFTRAVVARQTAPVCASAGWWYWGTTEEASALA